MTKTEAMTLLVAALRQTQRIYSLTFIAEDVLRIQTRLENGSYTDQDARRSYETLSRIARKVLDEPHDANEVPTQLRLMEKEKEKDNG